MALPEFDPLTCELPDPKLYSKITIEYYRPMSKYCIVAGPSWESFMGVNPYTREYVGQSVRRKHIILELDGNHEEARRWADVLNTRIRITRSLLGLSVPKKRLKKRNDDGVA